MTVKQLIQILQNSPPNDQVLIQFTVWDLDDEVRDTSSISKIVSGGGLTTLEGD